MLWIVYYEYRLYRFEKWQTALWLWTCSSFFNEPHSNSNDDNDRQIRWICFNVGQSFFCRLRKIEGRKRHKEINFYAAFVIDSVLCNKYVIKPWTLAFDDDDILCNAISSVIDLEEANMKFQRNVTLHKKMNRNESLFVGWQFCGFNAVTFENNNEELISTAAEAAKSNFGEGERKPR